MSEISTNKGDRIEDAHAFIDEIAANTPEAAVIVMTYENYKSNSHHFGASLHASEFLFLAKILEMHVEWLISPDE